MADMSRTEIQRKADRIDLSVYRLIDSLHAFADRHKDSGTREMAITLSGLRYRVRKHMHPKDREATS